ncbi:MAG: cytochrome bo3 quinol oxidase subunit 3 [Nitrobacter sp.]|uniref:cytochrome c oxidase subunit 3 n=1 Tax=Nitrobacter sp. TaxID=29420 RepID=UPI00387DFCF8
MTDAVITDEHAEQAEAAQEIDEKIYGFWICLMSDAIIFALLCAIFVAMAHSTAEGPTGHTLFQFQLPRIFVQTLLLLASSATFGVTGVAIAAGNGPRAVLWLGVTFLLGLGFVSAEIWELYGMAVADAGPGRSGFLSAFFTLVGTHGAHVGAGLVWIVLLGCEVALRGLTPCVVSRVHRLGLFWHFLVIVWINIFSLVYLPGFL